MFYVGVERAHDNRHYLDDIVGQSKCVVYEADKLLI